VTAADRLLVCLGGISRWARRRRCPSDMSDGEWAVCEPQLPHPCLAGGQGGRPPAYCLRDVADGIRYLTYNGPVWPALPAGLDRIRLGCQVATVGPHRNLAGAREADLEGAGGAAGAEGWLRGGRGSARDCPSAWKVHV
jgi:transposase